MKSGSSCAAIAWLKRQDVTEIIIQLMKNDELVMEMSHVKAMDPPAGDQGRVSMAGVEKERE